MFAYSRDYPHNIAHYVFINSQQAISAVAYFFSYNPKTKLRVLPQIQVLSNETHRPSLNMPGYFVEDGHRAMVYVEDPNELNFEPQQFEKLRQLGLKKRRVEGNGNCYYYAAAHQLGKPAPDNLDTCTQMRNEIGFYLRSNPNLWQTDIEQLVDHRRSDKGPMSTRAYNMTIADQVEKNVRNKIAISR